MPFVVAQVVGEENIPANLDNISGYLPTMAANFAKDETSGIFLPFELKNQRLKVDVVGDTVITDMPRFGPRVFADKTDRLVTGNGGSYTILDTGEFGISPGQVEFIMVRVEKDTFDIELVVDEIQVYKLNLKDLKDEYKLKERHEENGFFIGVGADKKQFINAFLTPADFCSSLVVKAYNNESKSKKILASLIMLREERYVSREEG
jgi:hypothetical protein